MKSLVPRAILLAHCCGGVAASATTTAPRSGASCRCDFPLNWDEARASGIHFQPDSPDGDHLWSLNSRFTCRENGEEFLSDWCSNNGIGQICTAHGEIGNITPLDFRTRYCKSVGDGGPKCRCSEDRKKIDCMAELMVGVEMSFDDGDSNSADALCGQGSECLTPPDKGIWWPFIGPTSLSADRDSWKALCEGRGNVDMPPRSLESHLRGDTASF